MTCRVSYFHVTTRNSCYQRTTQMVWTHKAKRDIIGPVLDMDILGKRPRGRPGIRWTANVGRDTRDDQMAEDRKVWSTIIATAEREREREGEHFIRINRNTIMIQ